MEKKKMLEGDFYGKGGIGKWLKKKKKKEGHYCVLVGLQKGREGRSKYSSSKCTGGNASKLRKKIDNFYGSSGRESGKRKQKR